MSISALPAEPIVLRFDAQERLTGLTRAAAAAFGLDGSALGRSLDRLAADHGLAGIAAALRAGEPRDVVDGGGRRWRATMGPETTTGEEPSLVVALTPTVEAPRATDDAPSFAVALARADLPAAVLDVHGRVRWANPALAALVGEPATRLVGADWFERLVPATQRAALRRRFARARGVGTLRFTIAHGEATAGGAGRSTAWHALPLGADGDGGAVLIGRDVTAERRARRALKTAAAEAERRSARESERLAACARELCEPLRTLRFAEAALDHCVDDPAGREVVGALAEAVGAMTATVDTLVAAARPEPFDPGPGLATVALGGVVAAVDARFAAAAAAAGVTLDVVSTTARVRSDPAALASALDALVASALGDIEAGGRVLVGCRRRVGTVVLKIADTRTEPPTTELVAPTFDEVAAAAGGYDAGGALRRLQALAGHRLEVRTVFGRGTVVAVHLPAAPTVRQDTWAARGTAVLLIVEEADERHRLARLLEAAGYAVNAATAVEAALAAAQVQPPPDVAVVDGGVIADTDPATLQRYLRARAGAPLAVVVLVDARPTEGATRADEAVAFLEKPVEPHALLDLVAELARSAAGPDRPAAAVPTTTASASVAVIAADAGTRAAVVARLRRLGHAAVAYASGESFLAAAAGGSQAGCVVLGAAGLGYAAMAEIAAVARGGWAPPVIVAHRDGDVALAVAAMRAGAFDVVAERTGDAALAEAVRKALREGARRERGAEVGISARHRFERLTARERDVLRLVVAGRSSKEVAQALGISPRTVENHRAHIMEKTGAHSLVELLAGARHAGLAE